jgi:hypothetical protein
MLTHVEDAAEPSVGLMENCVDLSVHCGLSASQVPAIVKEGGYH